MPPSIAMSQTHYEQLAEDYAARANAHANERYRLECLKWLADCQSILDVGCGTADLLAKLRPRKRVLGIDMTPAMLAAGPGRGYVAASAAEHLPFADASFDGAVSINLLEHVPEPSRVLKELARVLCNGGRVVLTTPADEWATLLDLAERFRLKIPEGPHQFLRRGELLHWAAEANLRTVEYRRILTFPIGGKRLARAERFIEQWTLQIGTLHLLVAEHQIPQGHK